MLWANSENASETIGFLWITIVLRSRLKIQLAKNSTCSRAILDLLHSNFLNVANCTRCARAILQHLKKSRAINPE